MTIMNMSYAEIDKLFFALMDLIMEEAEARKQALEEAKDGKQ